MSVTNEKGLHGYEFLEYFNKVTPMNRLYKGVYSLDDIPKSIKVKEFLVVNLSKKNEEGSHWFCIVRSHLRVYEIFNSLGFTDLDAVLPYLKITSNADLVYNQTPFQLPNTTTCGLYVIFFLVYRMLNLDLNFYHVLEELFDANNALNENKVTSFCQHLKDAEDDSDVFDLFD